MSSCYKKNPIFSRVSKTVSSRIDELMEEEAKEMGGGRRGKDSRKVGGGEYPTCVGVEKCRGKGEGEGEYGW